MKIFLILISSTFLSFFSQVYAQETTDSKAQQLESSYQRDLKGAGARWYGQIDHTTLLGPGITFPDAGHPRAVLGVDPITLKSAINIIPIGKEMSSVAVLDPLALDLKMVRDERSHASNLSFNYLDTFPSLLYGEEFRLTGGERVGLNTGISMWKSWMAPSFATSISLKDGLAAYMGLAIFVLKDRSVEYLGPLESCENLNGIHKGEYPWAHQGLHGLQVTDTRKHGGLFDIGLFIPQVGLGVKAKLIYFKTRLNGCKVFLPLKTVQNYIIDGKKWGITRFFQKLYKESLPDIKKPEKLVTNEEINYSVEQDAAFLFSMGTSLFFANVNALRAGVVKSIILKYQVNIKKLPENKVELSLSDMQVNDWNLFLRALIVMGLTRSHSLELTKNQKFVLDLNKKGARKFYDEAIAGQVPSFLNVLGKNIGILKSKKKDLLGDQSIVTEVKDVKDIKDIKDLWPLFHQDIELLQKRGVTRTFLETIKFPLTRTSATMRLYWLPSKMLPGLSYEKLQGQGLLLATDGENALKKEISVQNTRKDLLYKTRSSGIVSIKKTFMALSGGKTIKQLDVQVFLEESRVGRARREEIAQKIYEDFKLTSMPQASLPGLEKYVDEHKDQKEDFSLVIERSFSKKDILSFLKVSAEKLEDEKLKKLQNDLKVIGFAKKFNVLENFIKQHGQEGVVALHSVLMSEQTNQSNLNFQYSSSLYPETLDAVKEFFILNLDAKDPYAFEKLQFSVQETSPCKEKEQFAKKVIELRNKVVDRIIRANYDSFLQLNKFKEKEIMAGLEKALHILSLMHVHAMDIQK